MTDTPEFRMPAEWEPHAATWLTWPHDSEHWPVLFRKIPAVWARIVKELEDGEGVHLLVHDDLVQNIAKRALDEVGATGRRNRFHRIHNNFSWMRDHGPIFVKDASDEIHITHWKYNAWGGKWRHDLDDVIPSEISMVTGIPEIQIPMVLEGGSIDVNGQGTLLTTESCLLNPNRNPTLSREQIETHLRRYLGATNILWLGEGIEGDDTDGHVDDLTRFVKPNTVVTVIENSKTDKNYGPLKENATRLAKLKDEKGRALEIIEIPLPAPVIYEDTKLPASYANFYIGNRAVLVPIFNDPADQVAIDRITSCFQDRRVVGINARDLIWGLGAFHCITQQQPA